jgi:hypothetical protein
MNAIELATRVIDLTRKESNLRPVTDKMLPDVNFLEEVFICNSYRCVYFKDKTIDPEGAYHFDLGVLKLPGSFQHVAYTYENGVLKMPNKNTLSQRDYDIYTSLLMKIEDTGAKSREYFHSCENDDEEIMPRAVGNHACAELVTPRRDDIKFILFYYEGALKFYDGERTGKFYLISLTISERIVFFYAIETPEYGLKTEEIAEWLRLLEENPERADKIRIDVPMFLNDKMGIWLSPQARFAF